MIFTYNDSRQTASPLVVSRRTTLRLIGLGAASAVIPSVLHGCGTGQQTVALVAPKKLPETFKGLIALEPTPRGRVFVSDSLSYFSLRPDLMANLSVSPNDILVGSSFAGQVTFVDPLSLGAKGIIAHAAGVGKDRAGISGLSLADTFGVPAAAAETMSARMSDGRSLYEDGIIGHLNQAAEALGIRVGTTVRDAAFAMLNAPTGAKRQLKDQSGSHTSGEVTLVKQTDAGSIYTTWFIALVKKVKPQDVFVTGTHCSQTMAEYAMRVRPKGIIANDAGFCRDRSGVIGLSILDREGIPGAAVAAMSARIGDGMSSYRDGIISVANKPASERGVKSGMSAQEASDRLVGA